MRRAACKDWAEASCLISNLLAELEQPCRICREDSLVLTGRSPTGETVTIRLGPALMNGAEAICSCIEGANLIDLRERPAERLAMQREALCACKKLERKILRMEESKQYPGVSGQKAATWSKAVMTVRYMCAAWYEKDRSRAAQAREDVRRR